MVWFKTEYLGRADETVQPVMAGNHMLYVHYKNGYHSLIEGITSLHAFLQGDVNQRVACTDSETELIALIRKYE